MALPLVSCLAFAQTGAPPALAGAQAFIDAGQFRQAEGVLRGYIASNPKSAEAHYLLGFLLFRAADPKSSLAEYVEAAKYGPPSALDFAVEGCDYFLLEDYASAQEKLGKSVFMDPKNALARYYLGRTNYNQKHFEQAVQDFTECLKLDAGNSKAANYLGLTEQELGRIEEAVAAYQSAISLDKNNAEAYLNLGTILVENSRAADGVASLKRAIELMPASADAHRELGKALLLLRRFDDAQHALDAAARIAPDNAPVHYLLAQAYRGRGQTAQADAETARYASLTGSHSAPDTPLAEARSLTTAGQFAEAERVTRLYLKANTVSAEGHYLLGYILFKEQRPKESLAEYTEAAKYRTPTAADIEAVAGDYVLLKDYPDADKWFTKAVEWNPSDALGWYYLGRTKYNENRFDEAITAFARSLKLEPRSVKAQDNLGLSLEGLNRTDEAMAAYKTAIDWQASSAIQDAGPFLNLGTLLADNGNAEEALAYLKKAAAIAGEDYRVHRQLGKAYTRLSQLENARVELEKAVELAPGNAPLHFMLAQVYRKQGLTQKAKVENDLYAALSASAPAE